MATQAQYEQSLINQLRITSPQLDTKLGTPIRKLISAVASELANLSTDITTTNTLYSIDSYSGDELEQLCGLFGFYRQQAKSATGTVTLSRDNADSLQAIAYGSQFYKPASSTQAAVYFQTTAYQEFGKGVTRVDVPVIATVAGKESNVAANTVTYTVAYQGYFSVTNNLPLSGGRDLETDAELRSRFVNTIFRGEFGTADQYAGLALAHTSDTRASVIGQESTWNETISVLDTYNAVYDKSEVAEMLDVETRFWVRNADTDRLYSRSEYQVDDDAATIFFHDIENDELIGPIARGKTYTLSHENVTRVDLVTTSDGVTEITEGYTVNGNEIVIEASFPTDYLGQTLLVSYVYKAAKVGDFITVEYDYLSNLNRGGIKTVEIFVDGKQSQRVTDILFLDFNKRITSANKGQWRRADGSMPTENSLYIPLTYQPIDRTDNGEINVGASIILREGQQFHVIYDSGFNNKDGSTRGIDAIEFVGTYSGEQGTFTPAGTTTALTNETPLNVPYLYNSVPGDIQEVVDRQSVVTANSLVHQVRRRYFGIHLTLMFNVYTRDSIMQSVETAIINWASNLPFGHTIQMSDIITVAANVAGVDNVRITTEADAAGASAKGSGTYGAYGLVEYYRDGATQAGQYLQDFDIKSNECFEVQYVTFISRTQQGW